MYNIFVFWAMSEKVCKFVGVTLDWYQILKSVNGFWGRRGIKTKKEKPLQRKVYTFCMKNVNGMIPNAALLYAAQEKTGEIKNLFYTVNIKVNTIVWD